MSYDKEIIGLLWVFLLKNTAFPAKDVHYWQTMTAH